MKTQHKLCISCMKEHDVKIVEVQEKVKYKNEELEFIAIYEYCPDTDEYLETEDMIRTNRLALKEAYQIRKENIMKLVNNKIQLSEEGNKIFVTQFQLGVAHQLHKEKLLTNMQLNELLKLIEGK